MYLEVYPDIVFILNFCIDFFLIFLLKKINRKQSKFFRMAMAAVIGAVSAVIISIFPWMNIFVKLFLMYVTASILMIVIAFGRLKPMDYIKQLVVLNLITYFVGGLMNSVYYHTNFRLILVNLGNGIIFSNISWVSVGVAVLAITALSLFLLWLLRLYHNHAPLTYEVELVLKNRTVHTKGLMDTGNCLYDPIFKKPVMVMENSLAEELLTSEFRKDMEAARNYLEGKETEPGLWESGLSEAIRFSFIPYRAVGKSGMLLGIKLDKVLIHTGKETICNEKVTAAICDNRLSAREDYHVILHKELL